MKTTTVARNKILLKLPKGTKGVCPALVLPRLQFLGAPGVNSNRGCIGVPGVNSNVGRFGAAGVNSYLRVFGGCWVKL